MCLVKQGSPKRLEKDELLFKVFRIEKNGQLLSIHNSTPILSPKLKSDRIFESRYGYQAFKTREEAKIYCDKLEEGNYEKQYITKDLLVKRGALKRKGTIGYGFIHSNAPALQVSSGTILNF